MHDFHFSRTDVHWNRKPRPFKPLRACSPTTWNWPSDTTPSLGKTTPYGWETTKSGNGADSAIAAWLDRSLILQWTALVELTWVGKEVELDVSYLYLESRPLALTGAESWRAKNTMLFAEFDDQVNEVHLHALDSLGEEKEKREMLTRDMPAFLWDINLVPHE